MLNQGSMIAALAVGAIAIGGCGGDDATTNDGSASELLGGQGSTAAAPGTFDLAALEKQLGQATGSGTASCQEPASPAAGAQFQCTVDSDAGPVTLDVTQEDDKGSSFSYQGKASSGGFTQEFEGTVIVN